MKVEEKISLRSKSIERILLSDQTIKFQNKIYHSRSPFRTNPGLQVSRARSPTGTEALVEKKGGMRGLGQLSEEEGSSEKG